MHKFKARRLKEELKDFCNKQAAQPTCSEEENLDPIPVPSISNQYKNEEEILHMFSIPAISRQVSFKFISILYNEKK